MLRQEPLLHRPRSRSGQFSLAHVWANPAKGQGLASHSLTLSISGSTGGSVSGEGTYYQGSSASISAVPDTGYSFNGWTGEGITDPTQASTSISMGQSRNISASFAINSYDLSVTADKGFCFWQWFFPIWFIRFHLCHSGYWIFICRMDRRRNI